MRALLKDAGGVRLAEVADPDGIAADEVRVRVTVAGICRTDIYVAQGRIPVREPLVLGHEFTGVVAEAGSASGFRDGDHVAAIPLLPCRDCAGCRTGRRCAQPLFLGLNLDGAFADEIVLPARNLRLVPESLDPRRAAYVEPVAAAMAVLNPPLPKNGLGVVLGDSRIAMLTERILRHAGFASITRLAVGEAASVSNVAEFAVETEATEVSLQRLLDVVRPGGTAVLKSRPSMPVPFNVALAVKKDITVHGVSYAGFDQAIDLLVRGDMQVDDLLGPVVALEDFATVIPACDRSDAVKTFFRIGAA
jgi:L-iditol 2-dehydrogenase